MSGAEQAVQYGALCWRGGQVLLVTSRDTGRWIIPKGWPMEGKAPHEAAAQEAWEEAGVRGAVDAAAVGAFHYDKVRKNGEATLCRVEVFALEVAEEADEWPERRQRRRQWFAPAEAAELVDEPELRALLRAWSSPLGGSTREAGDGGSSR